MSENKPEITGRMVMDEVKQIREELKTGLKANAPRTTPEIQCPDGDCQLKYDTTDKLIEHWNRKHNHPVKHVLECADCGEELKRAGYTKAVVFQSSKTTAATGTADTEWSPWTDEPAEEPVTLPGD